MNNING